MVYWVISLFFHFEEAIRLLVRRLMLQEEEEEEDVIWFSVYFNLSFCGFVVEAASVT